jgi:hypothetical protein
MTKCVVSSTDSQTFRHFRSSPSRSSCYVATCERSEASLRKIPRSRPGQNSPTFAFRLQFILVTRSLFCSGSTTPPVAPDLLAQRLEVSPGTGALALPSSRSAALQSAAPPATRSPNEGLAIRYAKGSCRGNCAWREAQSPSSTISSMNTRDRASTACMTTSSFCNSRRHIRVRPVDDDLLWRRGPKQFLTQVAGRERAVDRGVLTLGARVSYGAIVTLSHCE